MALRGPPAGRPQRVVKSVGAIRKPVLQQRERSARPVWARGGRGAPLVLAPGPGARPALLLPFGPGAAAKGPGRAPCPPRHRVSCLYFEPFSRVFRFRAIQYACMLLRYLLEPQAGREEVVTKLRSLEASASSGRKCKYLSGGSAGPVWPVALAGSVSGGCPWGGTSEVTRLHGHGLPGGVHTAPREPPACSVAEEETEWLQSLLLLLFRALRRHPPLFLDTVKNLCDLLIPLDQLGIYRSNPGVIGLGGLVSSVAGIVVVACPHLKLKTR
ncbi:PREDICTED: peroxisomal membrane protein 11A [Condylura cristata]|uniref:peroxisomal membrane protein 11A n=1 Tax=Condylura cristata TaxID=143302 RepID=UPI00064321CB|nr:PREDICTED: peroxisomal membrane protein 11A [Condylura cristata]